MARSALIFALMNSDLINDSKAAKHNRGGGRAFHSRLEPFVDFIRELRQRRKTWQEIAALLGAEKGCAITHQGLHQFYRRYVRQQARPHWEDAHERGVVPSARPNEPASRPEPGRKPVLAATPTLRTFRQPKPDSLELNDPTQP
jgi:hypothetical protein